MLAQPSNSQLADGISAPNDASRLGGLSTQAGLSQPGAAPEFGTGTFSMRQKFWSKAALKRSFRTLGVDIRRAGHDWTDTTQFLPLESTLQAAKAAHLSLGDYIDEVVNKIPGATQATIDGMRKLGVFDGKISTVIEIGPGSGRYLEKTIAACSPERYEIYETAEPWAKYVERTYGVIRQATNGRTLAGSASASADLVQAHKVFCGISLTPTLSNWREMARVTRPGGHVVFDVITEECLSPQMIERWVDADMHLGPYPATIPKAVCVNYFAWRNFDLKGTFQIKLGQPGTTEVLVFQRRIAS